MIAKEAAFRVLRGTFAKPAQLLIPKEKTSFENTFYIHVLFIMKRFYSKDFVCFFNYKKNKQLFILYWLAPKDQTLILPQE